MSAPSDFTVYVSRTPPSATVPGEPCGGEEVDANAPAEDGGSNSSLASTIRFNLHIGNPAKEPSPEPTPVTARALICRCFRGRYMSVTCRTMTSSGAGEEQIPWLSDAWLVPEKPLEQQPPQTDAQPQAEQQPQTKEERLTAEKQKRMDESTTTLLDEIWRGLKLDTRAHQPTGLIVIAGRTGSAKSSIAQAFIKRYMTQEIARKKDRRPHLLTYEDPIEKLFYPSPEAAALAGYDYTPREKFIDVPGLSEATRDALRQTPTLFYVGETRDEQDWKELLRFAGTGHLTITTGHAGSLVETMAQVLHAAKARTPAQRSRVAGRVAALIHLRPHYPEGQDRVLIPAFWFRSSRAISAFTAEGLGSLLPNRPGNTSPCDSYGRTYAVQEFPYLKEIRGLKQKALEWDLRGD